MLNQQDESFPFDHGLELNADLDTAIEGSVRDTHQGLRQSWMAYEPDADEVARIKGKVEEGGEVAEEFDGQVLRLIDDPQGHDLLGID